MPSQRTRSSAVRLFSDGPLRARPPEEIAYGTGQSALGPVLVASSDKGIVSILIGDKPGPSLSELKARFPKANLVRNEKDCAPAVAGVIRYVAAPFERFALPLDLRGTEFQCSVWRAVQEIPFGQTSSYSRIAEAIGAPKAIRAVASSCTHCWLSFAVPCHRVLHKAGALRSQRDPQAVRRMRWVDYEARLLGAIPAGRAR